MWLKMCPKCKGDLYLRQDFQVEEIACMQCGFILYPELTKEEGKEVEKLAGSKRAA